MEGTAGSEGLGRLPLSPLLGGAAVGFAGLFLVGHSRLGTSIPVTGFGQPGPVRYLLAAALVALLAAAAWRARGQRLSDAFATSPGPRPSRRWALLPAAGGLALLVLSGPLALWILASWAALFLATAGLGALTLRLLRARPARALGCTAFWVGFAAATALLQVGHLGLPARQLVWPLAALGALGLVLERRALVSRLRRVAARPPRVLGACLFLVACLLANRTLLPPSDYDSGLYHLSAIRWTATYPAVPGLGNLHERLANDFCSFLTAAALEGWPGVPGHRLAGPLLLLVLAASVLSALRRVARGRAGLADGVLAFLAPALLFELFADTSSPAPDGQVYALTCVIAARAAAAAERGWPAREARVLALLCALLFCTKLTGAAFAVAVGALTLAGSRQRPVLCGLALVLLVPWAARGVVTSGYVGFPLTALPVDVEWRMPSSLAAQEAGAIRAHLGFWTGEQVAAQAHSLTGGGWIRPWLGWILTKTQAVLFPLGVLFVGLTLAGCRGPSRRWLLLLPPTAGLLVWLVYAPNPRFLGALIWVAAATAWTLAVGRWSDSPGLSPRAVSASILALALFAGVIVEPSGPALASGLGPAPSVPVRAFRTDSGLTVWVPEEGDQCWDATLPCTPYPRPGLRERVPGDLGSGFVLPD